jgi:hypothetical protein
MKGDFTYTCDSCIRGYHVYHDIWTRTLEECLVCEQQAENLHDRYAVSVMKDGAVHAVGHLPKKISRLSSLFIGHGGRITVTVTGQQQHLHDLPQGGMEIPCSLSLSGSK